MNCDDVQSILSRYVDGETTPAAAREVQQHLSTCTSCAGIEAGAREDHHDLERLFAPERAVGASVAARVARDLGVIRTRRIWPAATVAAAAGFLLAAITMTPWRDRAPATPDGGTQQIAAARDAGADRARVAALLARLGAGEEAVEDEIREIAACSCQPLAEIALDPGEAAERAGAARILADLAEPEDAPALIRLLSDGDVNVREHAMRGLRRLTGRDFGIEGCPTPEKDWTDWTSKHFGCEVMPAESP